MTKLRNEHLLKLSPKSQIVVMKDFRKALDLKPGSMLTSRLEGKRIILEPFDVDKEMEKIEKIAHMIGKKWPKGLSAVEAIRQDRE